MKQMNSIEANRNKKTPSIDKSCPQSNVVAASVF